MPNPTRLLRRQPKIDPAHIELARSITMARLSTIFDPESAEAVAPDERAQAAPEPLAADIANTADAPARGAAPLPADLAPAFDALRAEAVAAPTESIESVDIDAMPVRDQPDDQAPPAAESAAADLTEAEAETHRVGQHSADAVAPSMKIETIDDPRPEHAAAVAASAVMSEGVTPAGPERPTPALAISNDPPTDRLGWDLPVAVVVEARHPDQAEAPTTGADASEAAPSPPKRSRRARRPAAPRSRPTAARSPEVGTAASGPVAVIASCPYCALLLEPPPAADRRCTRCRQRIIVRRAHGRVVYLTEAAVQVFEAERRRVANTGRWTRDRERWLKLAASVEAPAGRIARLERAALSDEVVASSRTLYESTVERLVRFARRDRRWDEVARLRRDEALALHRASGSPMPPLGEIAALHRDGALAALRGIGEIARQAALVGVECCDSCRADVGRQFRINAELRDPRLPHPGCPAGLCRCHWELTPRDRDVIGGYLRRHARPDRVAPSA